MPCTCPLPTKACELVGSAQVSFKEKVIFKEKDKCEIQSQPPKQTVSLNSGQAGRVKGWSLYTIDDEIAVDKVARYENLKEEIQLISRNLGLPEKLELPYSKASFRKGNKSYRNLLDQEDKREIAMIFSKKSQSSGSI